VTAPHPVPTPIVALDVPSGDEALALVERLGDSCRFYKVGSELFTAEGPAVVRRLRAAGADVFLDLKFHDIPNTVAGAVRGAVALGVRLCTVHGSGGADMLRAAAEAAAPRGDEGTGCQVLAVTILTSLSGAVLAEAWGRGGVSVQDEVRRLAWAARVAGLHGVVCSGLEAGMLAAEHGDALATLVPGVRPEGSALNDQARVVTPGQAARARARYVVLGRAVTGADEPSAAMEAIVAEMAAAVAPAQG
jgi:orotidine-5'-phosphate decarboxylase